MDKKAFQNIQKKLGLTNEGVSEALDVELFTVQMWARGTWPVPRPIVKFLRLLLSTQRDSRNGGSEVGCEHSYAKGFNNGYIAAMRTIGVEE